MRSEYVYTHQFVGERLVSTSMRFELAGKWEAISFVVAYAPTDCTKDTELEHIFWQKLEDLVEKITTKECLFVLKDANARTDGDDEVQRLDHVHVIFVAIMTDESRRSPPIAS